MTTGMAEWVERIVVLAGQRAGQDVSENTPDVAGRATLRLPDHLRTAIESVDLLAALGKLGRERSGTAADIQHPPTAQRQLAQQQPVVRRVVIPVEHSQTLPKASSRARQDSDNERHPAG